MERQRFYIKKYDWHVIVYYNACSEDAQEIIDTLNAMGCSSRMQKRAMRNLSSSKQDRGLTYSNHRKTCIVISEASSVENFANTFVHEICHASIHISSYCRFSTYSEQLAYLMGDISMEMLPFASKFMCKCCHKKN